MKPATKTLALINDALEADQGASYRQHLKELLPKMDDAYRGEEDAFRSHFGYSQVGKECARELWYNFRWAAVKQFKGRILRLFNRGHLEEARFLALLKMIGCKVWFETETGGQFRIKETKHSLGHAGSALDGIIKGIPDLPDTPVLGEFKTHNDKSFKELVRKGVRESKWMHYIQVVVYMDFYNLEWGLYMATNKNDDDLYAELIYKDPKQAERYVLRAGNIVKADEPPPKINNSPGFFGCRFCDYKLVCHTEVCPEINCRTCCHSTTVPHGLWYCEKIKGDLPKDVQMSGCSDHLFNPHMLNGAEIKSMDAETNTITIEWLNDELITYGGKAMSSQLLKDKANN